MAFSATTLGMLAIPYLIMGGVFLWMRHASKKPPAPPPPGDPR